MARSNYLMSLDVDDLKPLDRLRFTYRGLSSAVCTLEEVEDDVLGVVVEGQYVWPIVFIWANGRSLAGDIVVTEHLPLDTPPAWTNARFIQAADENFYIKEGKNVWRDINNVESSKSTGDIVRMGAAREAKLVPM